MVDGGLHVGTDVKMTYVEGSTFVFDLILARFVVLSRVAQAVNGQQAQPVLVLVGQRVDAGQFIYRAFLGVSPPLRVHVVNLYQ